MIDKEFEESLLELRSVLRSVLCDERIAKYCQSYKQGRQNATEFQWSDNGYR